MCSWNGTHSYAACLLTCFSCVRLFATPWTVTLQASLSMGFSRQEYLEWVAMPSSRGSFWPKNRIHMSCIADRFFTHWATWEALKNTGVGCHALLQRIFLTQGSKPSLISPALAGMFFTTSTTPAGDLLYKDAPFLMEALHRLLATSLSLQPRDPCRPWREKVGPGHKPMKCKAWSIYYLTL